MIPESKKCDNCEAECHCDNPTETCSECICDNKWHVENPGRKPYDPNAS